MLIFLFIGADSAQITPPTHDNQSWNDLQIHIPITKKITGTMIGALRIGQNFRRPVDERVGGGISYKFNKYLTIGSNFFYRAAQPFQNRKVFETHWQNYLTVNIPLKKFLISDRNMIEYQSLYSRPNSWLYRNKLQIEREITIGKTKVKPFGFTESFYNGTRKDWFRTRLAGGVSKKFNSHFTLDVYYLRQFDNVSRPGNINAIGTTWKVTLPKLK